MRVSPRFLVSMIGTTSSDGCSGRLQLLWFVKLNWLLVPLIVCFVLQMPEMTLEEEKILTKFLDESKIGIEQARQVPYSMNIYVWSKCALSAYFSPRARTTLANAHRVCFKHTFVILVEVQIRTCFLISTILYLSQNIFALLYLPRVVHWHRSVFVDILECHLLKEAPFRRHCRFSVILVMKARSRWMPSTFPFGDSFYGMYPRERPIKSQLFLPQTHSCVKCSCITGLFLKLDHRCGAILTREVGPFGKSKHRGALETRGTKRNHGEAASSHD